MGERPCGRTHSRSKAAALGRELVHIAVIDGHKRGRTAQGLEDGDPVRLADIHARAV